MPAFFRNKRLIIILVSFILLVAIIGFSMRDRDELTLPEQFLKDTIGLVQNIFHVPTSFVSGFFDNISDIKTTYEENKLLKSRLSEYKNLLYDVQALRQENEELRNLLDKKESMGDYQPVQATVIARSTEPWFQQLTINKGKQHGVKANMAVITGDGMIGKIQTASQLTATVKLLSGFDRSNRIHAVVPGEKNYFGLIEGYDENKEALLLKRIRFDAELSENQMVVSSGMGGAFPRGLVIGTIQGVEMDEDGLTQTAFIKPAADLYEINHVMIVDRDIFSPVLDNEIVENYIDDEEQEVEEETE